MLLFFGTGGSRIWRSTLGGSDNGSLPIRDLQVEVLEKGLDMRWEEKAGRRKSGRTTAALRWAASN